MTSQATNLINTEDATTETKPAVKRGRKAKYDAGVGAIDVKVKLQPRDLLALMGHFDTVDAGEAVYKALQSILVVNED